MSVVVTGGAGFIGSHLSERLLREGADVSIIDDLNDFYAPMLKAQNLETIRKTAPFRFHEADICDIGAMEHLIAMDRPEVVVHLAARAGVRPSMDAPFQYERTNILGTMAMLEACRRHGVRRFIFASSSSVYGSANTAPFSESGVVTQTLSPYAATKIAGEQLCYTYSHLYSLEVVCLRFFTVYGPRQRPDLAIRRFAELILTGRKVPVFGDGRSARDYTYIDDIVDGILAAMQYRCHFETFNLGNCNPVTLTGMIDTIERALGRKALIERLPEQPGDAPITCADITKARLSLNFAPKIGFAEGVKRFVDWLLDNRNCDLGNPGHVVAHQTAGACVSAHG